MASEYGLFIGGYSNTISALHFHPAARSLSTIYTTPLSLKLAAPTWLVLLGDTLYALQEWGANQFGEGIITAFRIHRPAFSLELINSTGTGGMLPCHAIVVHNRILVVNYLSSTLASIPLLPSGALDDDPAHRQLVRFTGSGPHERQEKPHPHHILQKEGEIIVSDLGSDLLRRFKSEEGVLEELEAVRVTPGEGPRHSVSKDGKLYVVNELSNTVSVFSHTPSSSSSCTTIEPLQSISTLPSKPFANQEDFSTWHAAAIAIHSTTLYITNRAEWDGPLSAKGTDTIVIFTILPSGLLDPTPKFTDTKGRTPRHLSVSKDGKYLAVVLQDEESAVVIYERTEEGGLEEVVRMLDAGRPGCVLWDE